MLQSGSRGQLSGCRAPEIVPVKDTHDRVFVARAGAAGMLECLDHDGRPLWRTDVDGTPSCPPVVADINHDRASEILVGASQGTIGVWDAATGGKRPLPATAPDPAPETNDTDPEPGQSFSPTVVAHGPVNSLIVGNVNRSPGLEILATDATTLYCLSATLETLWTLKIGTDAMPAVVEGGDAQSSSSAEAILVMTRDGALTCVDGAGAVRWKDTRPCVSLAGPPVVGDLRGEGYPECVYAARDRIVRAVRINSRE